MAEIRINVSGLEKLPSASALLDSEFGKATQQSILTVEANVKPLTPVVTGTLRRSVYGEMTGPLSAVIGTPLLYARFIETGVRQGKRGTVRRKAGPAEMFKRGAEQSVPKITDHFEKAAWRVTNKLGA